MELHEIPLEGGDTLYQLADEYRHFGYFDVLPDGRARAWRATWHDRWAPTQDVYPGPVSIMRAMRRGEI